MSHNQPLLLGEDALEAAVKSVGEEATVAAVEDVVEAAVGGLEYFV